MFIFNIERFFPDGKPDAEEAGRDSDHDGVLDYIDSDKDVDGDGIPDGREYTGPAPWYSAPAMAESANLVLLLIVVALIVIIVVSLYRRCERWRNQRDKLARPGTVATQPITPVVPPAAHPSLSARGIDDAIAAGVVCLLIVTTETFYSTGSVVSLSISYLLICFCPVYVN